MMCRLVAMSTAPKIPFGYVQVPIPAQTARGMATWNGVMFVRIRKHNRKWSVITDPAAVVIRRAKIEQQEMPI